MMEWLKNHEYLAAWLGSFVGVIGLVLQQTTTQDRFSFRSFTIYLTFFTIMGVKLSGMVDTSKLGVDLVWSVCFFAIVWDTAGSKIVHSKSKSESAGK
jgi:hypothetical protein